MRQSNIYIYILYIYVARVNRAQSFAYFYCLFRQTQLLVVLQYTPDFTRYNIMHVCVCVETLLGRCSGASLLEYSISTQTRKTHTCIYIYMSCFTIFVTEDTIVYIGEYTQNCLLRIRFFNRNIILSI